MVQADSSVTLDDVAVMQLDSYNRHAERLLPSLLDIDLTGRDGTVIRSQEILAGWDLNNDADSAGAAIFEAIWRQLLKLTFHDDFEEDLWPTGGSRWSLAVAGMLEFADLRVWDDSSTPEVEDRDDMLLAAFLAGVAEVGDLLGGNPDEWEWGRLHGAVFRNETLGESGIGLIESRFNRGPYPVGGGTDIVNAVGWYADEGVRELTCNTHNRPVWTCIQFALSGHDRALGERHLPADAVAPGRCRTGCGRTVGADAG
jgi:penicillin amidase